MVGFKRALTAQISSSALLLYRSNMDILVMELQIALWEPRKKFSFFEVTLKLRCFNSCYFQELKLAGILEKSLKNKFFEMPLCGENFHLK